MIANIAIVVTTVLVMEVVAAVTHRFVMHGFGWAWHRSHHEPTDGPFELNDLYAVIFAAVSAGAVILAAPDGGPVYWIGIGLGVYGVLYFVVHDGLVHQRWPFRHVPRNAYLKRLVQAHRLHHAVEGREGCVSFGFLYAPPIRALRARLRRTGALSAAGDGEGRSA